MFNFFPVLRRIILIVAILFVSNIGYSQYKKGDYLFFLQTQNSSAKNYILSLFNRYDLVILCERSHKEFTQYQLVWELISDPWFAKNVGNIFTEVGVSNQDEKLNNFLKSKLSDTAASMKQFNRIYRNMDDTPYWEPYNFPWLLWNTFLVNQSQRQKNKIQIHPTFYEFDWNLIKDVDDYIEYKNNQGAQDSVMAQNIIKRFTKLEKGKRHKALVIMNYKHAFLQSHFFGGNQLHNTGELLNQYYPSRVASVYLMGLAIPINGKYTLVKNGLWDNLMKTKTNSLGFDLANNVFGLSAFDVIPPKSDSTYQYLYQDMFTGLAYYKSIKEHSLKTGWPGYVDDDFLPELRRRARIFIQV